jgi:hypothetical protein
MKVTSECVSACAICIVSVSAGDIVWSDIVLPRFFSLRILRLRPGIHSSSVIKSDVTLFDDGRRHHRWPKTAYVDFLQVGRDPSLRAPEPTS